MFGFENIIPDLVERENILKKNQEEIQIFSQSPNKQILEETHFQ